MHENYFQNIWCYFYFISCLISINDMDTKMDFIIANNYSKIYQNLTEADDSTQYLSLYLDESILDIFKPVCIGILVVQDFIFSPCQL